MEKLPGDSEQMWDQVFGPKDPDAILNQIDSAVESEDYSDREEGFLDLVEEKIGDKFEAKMIVQIAKQLMAYAESQE